jgi:hypothetical protein
VKFQRINEGLEVTEQDLIEAWRVAKETPKTSFRKNSDSPQIDETSG